jgi:riboflavin kinase/FMN adenylyltransferase
VSQSGQLRLVRGLQCPPLLGGCVATIGNFDGVHLGHRAVIENLAKHGKRLGVPVVVVLFEPQPREYFQREEAPSRLTRLREKLRALSELPVDRVLLLHFDARLSDLPAEQFIEKVLVERLRVRYLVVGDDFRFGRHRRGNFELLQEFGRRAGYEVADTVSVQVDGQRVSSTLIREALAAGNLDLARRMLGRPYSICGRIRAGARLGRQIGFPTANIALQRKKSPLQGVFAVTMSGINGRQLTGVANVGARPTVRGDAVIQLETHLFDFAGDLYGRLAEVHFHQKLREERRFESVDALTAQIARDAQAARDYFANLDPMSVS